MSFLDPQALDYETKDSYSFTVQVREDLRHLRFPADNANSAVTTAQVNIRDLQPSIILLFITFLLNQDRRKTIAYTVLESDGKHNFLSVNIAVVQS